MIVSIIGWYGTETMGDRAILDGILSILNEVEKESIVQIGSLYPFYTERTLYEEKRVFFESAPDISIKIFDVRNREEAKENIGKSDFLMIGGGPLMDLEEMFLVRNCFSIAEKRGIPRIVMGCGVGPLERDRYISVFKEIISKASLVCLRDSLSLKSFEKICANYNNAEVLGDPAVISIEQYKERNISSKSQEKKIVINFRDYPSNEYGGDVFFSIKQCRNIISYIRKKYDEVRLVPMHTFGVGGDDRLFLTKVIWNQNYEGVQVVHRPMNLWELYDTYADAMSCIGMRYHSVVMQTILNGNNYIVEYTNPLNGKISGFIDTLVDSEFYSNRRWNIREILDVEQLDVLELNKKYEYCKSNMKEQYIEKLKKCLK